MDYNARYYSPYLGRFISPDTIVPEPASPQGLNRYSYSFNNSVRYTDPSGHCPPELCEVLEYIQDFSADLVSQVTEYTDESLETGQKVTADAFQWTVEAGRATAAPINEALDYVKNDGTFSVSVGISGQGFGYEGVANLGVFHMDEKGNFALFTTTFGGGGATGMGLGVGPNVMGTNAADLSELGGWYTNNGPILPVAKGAMGAVNIDHVGGQGKNGNINGINPGWSIGPKIPKVFALWASQPGVHSNINYTIPRAVITSNLNDDGTRTLCVGSCRLDTFNEAELD